ncbi:hypothetical protein [Cysteiniphilum sp. QT6929]|uniref:hypothetical protein n=1 Tax=Cysteiniphilum sp. QT6929 TaxID=2975055 RepID=UPI0024B32467|nr:hypothetical protein [Cysteiniphilum sp. QT6929]WHN66019.1 hypothetical protein NYP54_01970 [Cysteiniphilum sp. QT6929]
MREKLLSASVLVLLIASTTYLNAYCQLVTQKEIKTTASAKSVGVNRFDHILPFGCF